MARYNSGNFMGLQWKDYKDLSSQFGRDPGYVSARLLSGTFDDIYHLIVHNINQKLIKEKFPYRGIRGNRYFSVCKAIGLSIENVDDWCVKKESDILALIDEVLENGMEPILDVINDNIFNEEDIIDDNVKRSTKDDEDYVYVKRSYLIAMRDLIDEILSRPH